MANRRELQSHIWWNLLLIATGSLVFAFGINAIIIHHNFINGGIFGTVLLIYYKTDLLSPGILYALIK